MGEEWIIRVHRSDSTPEEPIKLSTFAETLLFVRSFRLHWGHANLSIQEPTTATEAQVQQLRDLGATAP